MKKILLVAVTIFAAQIIGLLFLSSPVLARSCTISLQKTDRNETLPTPVNPRTSFRILLTVPGAPGGGSDIYSVKGIDSSGSAFLDLQTFKRLEGSGNGFTRFGPVNENGVLAPGNYMIIGYENSFDTTCGRYDFTVVDYPAPGTCTMKQSGVNPDNKVVDQNHCAQGYTATIETKTGFTTEKVCNCLGAEQTQNLPGSGTETTGGNTAILECVQTDLGCIPTEPTKLAGAIFSIIVGIAGALAILLIIVGGFKVATSAGSPDALEDGRDTITKAITGLVFILLATTILSIIGIDILGLTSIFGPGGLIPIRN